MNNLKIIKNAVLKHRWAYAERELLKILNRTPKDVHILNLLLDLYWKKQDDMKALKIAKNSYALFPNDPLVIWGYATCLSNVRKEKEAIKFYEKLLNTSNKVLSRHTDIKTLIRAGGFKLDVYVRIGECYADISKYEKAISCFKKYLKDKRKNIPSIYNVTIVKKYLKSCLLDYLFNVKEYNQKNYQIAQQAYAIAPDDPMVIWSFAGWTNNLFKHREAIRLYKKIIRKRKETLVRHPDIRTSNNALGLKLDTCVRIGECYMGEEEYKNAVPYFKKYLQEKKKNITCEYNKKIVKDYIRECNSKLRSPC